MISYNNGLFHIQGEGFSYLFRVTEQDFLEHIHFGSPVSAEDAQALACDNPLGWGASVLCDGVCLDVLPLEWSASGRGDYREIPVAIDGASADFRYRGYRILEGSVPMESGLPQAKKGSQTLEITLSQEEGPEIMLYYTLFDGVLTRRAVLKNTTCRSLTVQKLMSYSLDLPGSFEMTTFDGSWIAEMRRSTVPVGPARVVHESSTGASSCRHQPGFSSASRERGRTGAGSTASI